MFISGKFISIYFLLFAKAHLAAQHVIEYVLASLSLSLSCSFTMNSANGILIGLPRFALSELRLMNRAREREREKKTRALSSHVSSFAFDENRT